MGKSSMREYLERMAHDERLIIIRKNDVPHTLVTFSICNDEKDYVDKNVWEVIPHDVTGNTCYIEKIITDGWSSEIRKELQRAILTKYPQIEWAVWYRPGRDEDRKVVRRIREASLRD